MCSAIGDLMDLRFLYIGKNEISKLPVEIGKLENLVELDIAQSGVLLHVPEFISRLNKLEFLYIDRNTILPYSINNVNPRLRIVIKD